MLFRQYLHANPIGISYLFGCGGKGKGVVVDPSEDIDQYITDAKQLGLNIQYVFDTHLHADHISGGRKLAEIAGAQYILHRSAETIFNFTSVDDRDELMVGNTRIKILYTPGHTPEHISLLVTDTPRGEAPWFVVTGHTLMIGDVGRTELASNIQKGASDLYDSLFNQLMTLEDHIEVYPGAYSGSVCGRFLSGKPSSTIGFEKRFNQALQKKTKEEFVDFMMKNVPPQPENFENIRKINAGQM